jgi:hypothetical protein
LNKYLEIPNQKYLFNFFKFRISNHKLPIECGRWQNIDVVDVAHALMNGGGVFFWEEKNI